MSENQKKEFVDFILKPLMIEKIEVDESIIEYRFRDLMAFLFILSKDARSEKITALFKLFDYSNNNSLSKTELKYLFHHILAVVRGYSEDLFDVLRKKGNMDESQDFVKASILECHVLKKLLLYFYFLKKKVEKVVLKSLNYLLDGNLDKGLNLKEFREKMLDAPDKIKYDFLSTKG